MSGPDLAGSFVELLDRAHLSGAEGLPQILTDLAPRLGVDGLSVYLVDYSQRYLVSLSDRDPGGRDELSVDGTLAGRAYRDLAVHQSTLPGPVALWLPLLDGTERLGVLKIDLEKQPDAGRVQELLGLAGLVAEVLVARAAYGDAVERTRRRLPMSLAAELQWNLLPPLTCATPEVVISAALEPCYEIGGDSFDYAVNEGVLHAALFDAVGHGEGAAQLVALAIAAYRNGRRSGLDLADTATSIDRWISRYFPESFATGVLLELDTARGQLRTVNAGHPPALVFRDQRNVKSIDGPTRLPFGLGSATEGAVLVDQLERGDRVLVYSDGIIESRGSDGEYFGVDRLIDFIERQLNARLPAAETMRRLIHQILEHQHEALQDDASAVLVEWVDPDDDLQAALGDLPITRRAGRATQA
jgi:serine phosphatase RsbU (regulator of sigma subunit)